MQTDPIGTKDDLNLYAYVGSDPSNRIDPEGKAGVPGGGSSRACISAQSYCTTIMYNGSGRSDSKPPDRKRGRGTPTREQVETATGAAGVTADSAHVREGGGTDTWRGNNGKYNSESWGGNGATGSRKFALARKAVTGFFARFLGAIQVGQSAVDVGVDVITDQPDKLPGHVTDLGFATYGLFGGVGGAVIGAGYFIDKETGTSEAQREALEQLFRENPNAIISF